MTPTPNRSRWTPRVAALAAAAALAGCGGGLLALLPYVTPVGGSWRLDGNPATAATEEVTNAVFNISPKAAQPYLLDDPIQVEGTYSSPDAATQCGGIVQSNVEGAINDGQLVLRLTNDPNVTCLRGNFIDLATFQAQDGRLYRNGRVEVRLQLGVWVSDDGTRRLKFQFLDSVDNDATVAVTACDVASPKPYPVLLGTLKGFEPAPGAVPGEPPTIVSMFRDGGATLVYENGVMLDGATLRFDLPAGGQVRFRREADTTTTCP